MTSHEPAPYASPVLDHFFHPRCCGIVARATHRCLEQGNRWAIRILITLRVSEDRIEDAGFKARGCVTTIAAASALTERIVHATVDEALAITPEQLAGLLGGIPEEKMHCCRLVVSTLRRALEGPTERTPEEGDTP